jgi:hypothetical protein
MLKHFSFAIVAAAVAATSLAAQAPSSSSPSSATPGASQPTATTPAPSTTPATQNPSTTPSSSSASAAADRVTVTGCIERADQVATNPAHPGDPDSLQYVLVRPAAEQTSSNASPAPTGTTGTAGAGAESRVMYRLSGDQQKLNPHVGHKVEIVGTPSPMAETGRATAGATGASAPMPSGTAPGLTVENVRMVDATCTAAK